MTRASTLRSITLGPAFGPARRSCRHRPRPDRITRISSAYEAATVGMAENALPAYYGGEYLRRIERPDRPDVHGAPESATRDEVLNGANAAVLGDESSSGQRRRTWATPSMNCPDCCAAGVRPNSTSVPTR